MWRRSAFTTGAIRSTCSTEYRGSGTSNCCRSARNGYVNKRHATEFAAADCRCERRRDSCVGGLALRVDGPTRQQEMCRRHGTTFVDAPRTMKVGIARNVRSGLKPINGLRHPPEGDTTGWYIWAGEEVSADPGFFVPLHFEHLEEWCLE